MYLVTTKSLTSEWRSNNNNSEEPYLNLDRSRVKEVKDKWRPRFEQEFEDKKFPRHPYKVMQEIRKETGNYSNTLEPEEFYQGLDELKEEFKPRYQKLKKSYST